MSYEGEELVKCFLFSTGGGGGEDRRSEGGEMCCENDPVHNRERACRGEDWCADGEGQKEHISVCLGWRLLLPRLQWREGHGDRTETSKS